MKISNEQLRALQEAELQRSKQNKQAGGISGEFGDLLAKHLEPEASPSSVAAGAQGLFPQGLTTPLEGISIPPTEASVTAFSDEAATRMDGMFTSIERYAEQIGRGNQGDLREAYGLLQDVNAQIASFKSEYPNAGEEMPELAAMLNELDVLTTTETFKFNRGDYL